LVSDEVGMLETFLVLGITRLMEVVHVELTHEAAEVIMLKVLRKYVLSKCVRVFNYEASALCIPKNSVLVSWILNLL